MHLLAATPGAIDEGSEPVDLAQTPADLVVISAADTELAALAQARSDSDAAPTMRLANMLHLRHPMSVDLHLEQCATGARLVVARVLGGGAYWRYGLDQYAARLAEAGVAFAALPGDDKPDAELRALSSIDDQDYDALWACLVEGGPANAKRFIAHAAALIADQPRPTAAEPLLRAGLYWPGIERADLQALQDAWHPDAPVVPIVFYRALLQGAGLSPINRLTRALLRAGLNPMPVFVASLKDPLSAAVLQQLFGQAAPSVILNCTSFAVASTDQAEANPLAHPSANQAPVIQTILASTTEETWRDGQSGLSARDIAMNVALPEVDGRIIGRAISFKGEAYFDDATQCAITTYHAHGPGIAWTVKLALNWTALRRRAHAEAKIGMIVANYPNRDGRLANGVGLDTPQSVVDMLALLAAQGYNVSGAPRSSALLMDQFLAGPTNWLTDRAARQGGVRLPLTEYLHAYGDLPHDLRAEIEERWGSPDQDPFVEDGAFCLSIHQFGNVVVGLQPARGYNIDPSETYHAPDLVPPHGYLAFYFWLRIHWKADAFVHFGKHGNLEWLPGKALALSDACSPQAVLGPVPHIYPFIVNDPGEGTQAKRRTQAVIIDHLTPPLTRAETYGPLRDLEALVDEYYQAVGIDPRRVEYLRQEIISLTRATGLDHDVGMDDQAPDEDLAKLDAYLCELKEAQIRDGLHVFGSAPQGRQERDLVLALARAPRGDGNGANAAFPRALSEDLALGFDPLDCDMAELWSGPRPDILAGLSADAWRSTGDTVERIELLSQRLLDMPDAAPGPASAAVLDQILHDLAKRVHECGGAERAAFFAALCGRAVAPGPSGAPTRGRPDVLPTGRNFFSVDSRAIPTQTAWQLGWKSASLLIEKHLQDHGDWPRALVLNAWGTANMRTGGDDIAQALALMGVRPRWDAMARRVTGFEIIPITALGRPRVDVTLRISGFFRDAFPAQVDLVDSAARAIQALPEALTDNPAAGAARAQGVGARVYGAKPGAYGAGLQAMIDERLWADRADLAEAYMTWGSYAYGAGGDGTPDRSGFETRLSEAQAVVQNQDNREHDLLDSDDYYQFQGGAAAAIATLQGRDVPVYHNDHSRPERPVIRTLEDEIGRVVRSRVVNPKWIEGVKRHGYKGAFEIAATVDYLFAFSATTHAVANHHFDLVEEAVLGDPDTRKFILDNNAPALADIADRLLEAIERGLWQPKSNSARLRIDAARQGR